MFEIIASCLAGYLASEKSKEEIYKALMRPHHTLDQMKVLLKSKRAKHTNVIQSVDVSTSQFGYTENIVLPKSKRPGSCTMGRTCNFLAS